MDKFGASDQMTGIIFPLLSLLTCPPAPLVRRWQQWRPALGCGFCLSSLKLYSPSNQTSTAQRLLPVQLRPSRALVYGSGGQPVNLEPGNITDGNSVVVQEQIYNRLIEFKAGTTELEPSQLPSGLL